MSAFLEKINLLTQARLHQAKQITNYDELVTRAGAVRRGVLDFAAAIADSTSVNIIAEVKLASPSEGDIAPDLTPVDVAKQYAENGARALSVLTEPNYFKGQLSYLSDIRAALPDMPLLRKDFIIDEYQILEAKLAGADAVLLIMALTGAKRTKELYDFATAQGLHVLMEVHDQQEMGHAVDINVPIIGVNNRNLKTLEVSLDVSRELVQQAPDNTTLICESGLKTASDLVEMQKIGYDGFLIGTHFMRTQMPGPALRLMIEACE